MKKLLKFSLPFVAIALILGASFAQADYNVTVGTTNTYDIVESTQDITVEADNGGGDGFLFEDHAFAEGTQVEVEVTAASSSSVDYDVTVGSITDSKTSNVLGDVLGIAFTLIFPVFFTLTISGTWNQTAIDSGPGLFGYYFIDSGVNEAARP